ncbi:MAG: APC family permease [Rhodococcus sp. (in: high G+C Gram-positive bacteria)]
MVALTLTVLAFSAPLAAVSGFIPFAIIFGGTGTPFSFAIATALLLVFSIGFVTMSQSIKKPGAFYAFISSGLGRAMGLGSGLLAAFSYYLLLAGTFVFLGLVTNSLIADNGGPDVAWYVYTALGIIGVAFLGYFHVELSAKLLCVAMILEVLLVMIFNVFVVAKGGAEGLSAEPFSASAFMSGDIGVTMLFCILVFMGFESTAMFRTEVKNPDKTIPRATFFAVGSIGILYTLTAYTLVEAYGSTAQDVATASPATMFPDAIGKYVSGAFSNIALVLVITSAFAATLCIHNVLARYLHNLGKDNALPRYLGAVHHRHGSPHRSSITVSIIVAVSLLPFVFANADGAVVYGRMTGLGSVGIMLLMGLVSLGVIGWFARPGMRTGVSVLKAFVAPAVAVVAFIVIIWLAISHFELVVGGNPGQNTWMAYSLAGIVVFGALLATYFRVKKPAIYDKLGRKETES